MDEHDDLASAKRFGALDEAQPTAEIIDFALKSGRSCETFVNCETFFQAVENRLDERTKQGALAYLEIAAPPHQRAFEPFLDANDRNSDYAEVVAGIDDALGQGDIFCWYADRFMILVDKSNSALRALRRVSQAIANREWRAQGVSVHLTPIVAFLDLREAGSARELWEFADRAVVQAKSSLEGEPFRYVKAREPRAAQRRAIRTFGFWRAAPLWITLSVQLVISLLLGLGGPFVLYAVCDALGADISGPVYIGVVLVLVVTGTTIWIEGILALNPTAPPAEPGSPSPPATLIIPAYLPNEAATIMETLHAFLRLDYSNDVQIIVAYNTPGPRLEVEDEIAALAAARAGSRFLIEPLRVIGSTSKAQNVNAAVGHVRGRFVGIFDADHHPHPDSLERAWRWLSNGWDIVQGRCAIRNGGESWVARMVAVEFEQIYAVSHPGRARFHGFGIFGGSNGFWRTPVLHETRMRRSMLTEDIDSSIRAVIAGYRIAGDRDLVSEELAPTALQELVGQRLRWAQGWFQVSFRRVLPALMSPRVTLRQKLGLLHLLVWRELFPWYSIQVVPIMAYWVWVYGWSYIHWTVPVFLATTVFTLSTGPGQVLLAYHLAQPSMRRHKGWFLQYLVFSTLFYSPFKDALSRIAHVKEAMGEKAWKVTSRVAKAPLPSRVVRAAVATLAAVSLTMLAGTDRARAASTQPENSSPGLIATLLGGEASTINAARIASRNGHAAQAASLFEKAIRDVPRRRQELLPEYADALLRSNRSAEAASLYREMLSATPDAGRRQELRVRLAAALASSRPTALANARSNAAVRNTVAAIVQRTPVARLERPNREERSGDTTVELARAAAQDNRNADAAGLFADAIRENPARRPELLREYADQLNFSGSAAQATPLFLEVLGDASLASPVRRQAMVGLADSYRWSDRLPQALAAYDLLLSAYPADPGLQWTRTVVAARVAAKASRNRDAADLFAKAIAQDPAQSGDLLREYADQLSFSDRADQAVPLYRQVLAQPGLTPADRTAAQRGLAQAYEWSGQLSLAKAAYTDLVAQQPADVAMQRKLLIISARDAARSDDNRASAEFFAKAISQDPEHSGSLLAEYADQLSFTGRAELAIRFYVIADNQAGLTQAQRTAIDVGLAQAYDWSARYPQAIAAYSALLAADPHNTLWQWHLLVVSGREAAAANRNRQAAQFFAQAIPLVPSQRLTILKDYADQLSYSNATKGAIPLYRELLASPLAPADRRMVRLALAQALAWDNRRDEALQEYGALVTANPEDQSAELGLARTLSWAGRQAEAKAAYQTVLRLQPENGEALRGLAQAEDWEGHHRAAQALLDQRLRSAPGDLEARRLLAQSLVWSGEPDKALAELHRALEYQTAPSSSRRQPGERLSSASDTVPDALSITAANLTSQPAEVAEHH